MTDRIDEDMTILLGLHAHPGWLVDKCAACQAANRIMERVRGLGAELADLRAYHHRASDADFQLELREAAEARVRKLEAELADAEHRIANTEEAKDLMRDTSRDLRARAEKAEKERTGDGD